MARAFVMKAGDERGASSIPPRPVNSQQQDRRQRNKPNRTAQRNPGNIIAITGLGSGQISDLIQNHSATNPKSRRSQERQHAVARPKRQNERRRKFDQDSNKQMMNQISARIDMLNAHQVEIK